MAGESPSGLLFGGNPVTGILRGLFKRGPLKDEWDTDLDLKKF